MAGAHGKKATVGSLSLLCFLGICLMSVVCQRKLTTVYNPGCDIASCLSGYEGAALNVAYVKSEGENDTLHYLFSSVGGPSILVLQTLPGTRDPVQIDWSMLETGNATKDITQAITVTRDVRFSFGVAFTQLYEDTAVTSDLNQTEAVSYRFDQLVWEGIAGQPQMSAENAVLFRASLSTPNVTTNGTLSVKFMVLNDTDSETDYSHLPSLLDNNNLTRVDISVNEESPRPTEFGLEIVVISQDRFTRVVTDSNNTQTTTENYVPGAFKITDYVTKEANSKDDGNFHWTPTCNRRLTPGQSEETYKYERTYMLMTPEDNFAQSLPEVAKSVIHRYYAGVSSKLARTVKRVALGSQCATWYFGMTSSYRDSSQDSTCSFRQTEFCYGLCFSPHLDPQQKVRCQSGEAAPEVAALRANDRTDACQFQSTGRRWNCPRFTTRNGDREEPSIKGLSVAYMYAMSRTATMHSVTLTRPSCTGEVTQCGCHKGTELEHALGAFGSCSEDVRYLNAIPEQVFRKTAELICKCHGVSGSCPSKTCWLNKRNRGGRSRKKQKNVLRVMMYERGKNKSTQVMLVLPEVRDGDCRDAPERRRWTRCKKDSKGRSGCDFLCCGRGFHTLEMEEEYRCDCTFHWCCEVKCKTCTRKVEAYFCK